MSTLPNDAKPRATATDDRQLSGDYRTTLNMLFLKPMSDHVEWNHVRELFEQIGDVTQVSSHRFELKLGQHTLSFLKPHTAHLTDSEILELRQFVKSAGWSPQELATEAAANAPSGPVAVVVLSNHDARLFHMTFAPEGVPGQGTTDVPVSGRTSQTISTGPSFELSGGSDHLHKSIAAASATSDLVVVIGHLTKDRQTGHDLATYLRKNHKHSQERVVHEIACDEPNLDMSQIQSLCATAAHVHL